MQAMSGEILQEGLNPVPWLRAGPVISTSYREQQSDIDPATKCEKSPCVASLVPLIIPFITRPRSRLSAPWCRHFPERMRQGSALAPRTG